MDDRRFDDLARLLSMAPTRRAVASLLVRALGGGVAAAGAIAVEAAAKGEGKGKGKGKGKPKKKKKSGGIDLPEFSEVACVLCQTLCSQLAGKVTTFGGCMAAAQPICVVSNVAALVCEGISATVCGAVLVGGTVACNKVCTPNCGVRRCEQCPQCGPEPCVKIGGKKECTPRCPNCQVCTNGACREYCSELCPCGEGERCCDGHCYDLQNDPEHCGACDDAECGWGELCCRGHCKDRWTDDNNCGGCAEPGNPDDEHVCADDERCCGGKCCKNGRTCCDGVCCERGFDCCNGECFDESWYNWRSDHCRECNRAVGEGNFCCGGQIHAGPGQCCSTTDIPRMCDSDTEECCGGNECCDKETEECCGATCCNKERKACCGSTCCDKDREECCGDQCCDKDTQVCCAGDGPDRCVPQREGCTPDDIWVGTMTITFHSEEQFVYSGCGGAPFHEIFAGDETWVLRADGTVRVTSEGWRDTKDWVICFADDPPCYWASETISGSRPPYDQILAGDAVRRSPVQWAPGGAAWWDAFEAFGRPPWQTWTEEEAGGCPLPRSETFLTQIPAWSAVSRLELGTPVWEDGVGWTVRDSDDTGSSFEEYEGGWYRVTARISWSFTLQPRA